MDAKRISINFLLESAIDNSRGGITWNDVIVSIEQIRRTKVREQLDSTLSDFSIADLTTALEIAVKRGQPSLPAPKKK